MIEYLSLKKLTAQHGEEIFQAVNKVVQSGRYLQGEWVCAFEQAYANYIGTSYCVGCGNGFDALWLIFRACLELGRLKPGDEVIVPANTYIASILSITDNGLKPILVEPCDDTMELDGEAVQAAIGPRTRAMLLVHLYGRCAYTPLIEQLCHDHGLLVFEDNAQAHGCVFATKRTGSLGLAAAHSFYPGKNLGALGDAGAVTTSDTELAKVIRSLGNYGSSHKYVFPYRGRNSRLDELQAAVLLVKLKYLDKDNERRKWQANYYLSHIDNEVVRLPLPERKGNNVWHIFPLRSAARDQLQAWLQAKGIGTIIHYPIPPHRQGCYKEWNTLSLPITENIHHEELSIPLNPTLTNADVAYIVEQVNLFEV